MSHKLALVGAGHIGGTVAHLAAREGVSAISLYDIQGSMAQGKALDLMQAGAVEGYEAVITGGDDDTLIKDADVVIVTAGLPRKDGMSRDDLLQKNCAIIKKVGLMIKKHAPHAFVIVVTNPLDAMVWVMREVTGFAHQRVVGMAGILDEARFAHFLSDALGIAKKDIQGMILGGHGDLMLPLPRYTSIRGIPLERWIEMGLLSQKTLDAIIMRTRMGGGEIVRLLGIGSAYYAPAAAALSMAHAFIRDEKKLFTAAAWLNDMYDTTDIYAGVPVIIGKNGVEQIIELKLTRQEHEEFQQSLAQVRELIDSAKVILQG